MPFLIIGIILLVVGAFAIIAVTLLSKKILTEYNAKKEEVKQANARITTLKNTEQNILLKIIEENNSLKEIQNKKIEEDNNLKILETKTSFLPALEEQMTEAYKAYTNNLDVAYTKREYEFDRELENLTKNFNQVKENLNSELEKEEAALSKVRETRIAAVQAQLREEEIKKQLTFVFRYQKMI